jgi:tetratricopeptide (TPR) repeat protein
MGDRAGAEAFYRRSIALGRTIEPRYRIYLAQAAGFLGELLIAKESYLEAESSLRESEAVYREVLGDPNPSTSLIQSVLGRLYRLIGDYPRSEMEYRKSLEPIEKFFGKEHVMRLAAVGGLGVTLTRCGKAVEGETYLREALEWRKKTLPPGDFMIPFTESALGECLTVQKRYGEAEPLLTSSYERMKAIAGDKDSRVAECRHQVVQLYDAWGKPRLADRYR